MADITPGSQTSEFGLAKLAAYVGTAVIVLGGVLSTLTAVAGAIPQATWIGPVITGIGMVLKVLNLVNYTNARVAVKTAAANLSPSTAVAELTKP